MKKIIDISLPISAALPVWPGDPPVWMKRVSRLEEGGSANVTALRFGAHTGTHMDAPYHFIENGRTIDEIALDELIGPVQVLEIDAEFGLITAQVLDGLDIDPSVNKILFKTRNSSLWAQNSSIFLKITSPSMKVLRSNWSIGVFAWLGSITSRWLPTVTKHLFTAYCWAPM